MQALDIKDVKKNGVFTNASSPNVFSPSDEY